MDAKSLHNHISSSSAKTRLRIREENNSKNAESFFRNDDVINTEIDKEKLDQDGDGVISLMEELDGAEDAKVSAEIVEKQARSNDDTSSVTKKDEDDNNEKDSLPQATILSMDYENSSPFDFKTPQQSNTHIPQPNHQTPVEEAKPVKDNTTAIIMILLIAILIIAVAIFCAIVLGENRNTRVPANSQTSSSSADSGNNSSAPSTKNANDFTEIIGTWVPVSTQNSCLDIGAGAFVSWHAVCDDDASDNYRGQSEILHGADALNRAGINIERAARIVGLGADEVKLNNVYFITTTPDELVIDGQNSGNLEDIRTLFVLTNANEAHMHDYRNNELYILKRSAE